MRQLSLTTLLGLQVTNDRARPCCRLNWSHAWFWSRRLGTSRSAMLLLLLLLLLLLTQGKSSCWL